ncbi:MAG: hypothetical protein FJ295_11860 [Planctomycetes bacterium]|nr:hypothetical protein [Planctomycetota bacterium]
MSADKFLEHLESQGLLEQAAIRGLRKQVAGSRVKVTPEAVAKLLVDGGHLTAFQAKKLLGDFKAPVATPSQAARSDDLGLAPLGDEPAAQAEPVKPATKPASKAPPPKTSVPPATADPAAKKSERSKTQFKTGHIVPPPAIPRETQPLEAAATGLTPLSEELMPLDGGLTQLGGGLASPSYPMAAGGFGPAGPTPDAAAEPQQRVVGFRKKKSETFSTSMLILFGVPGLLLMIFMGWVLISKFTKGNAKDQFERGETAYKNLMFPQAIKEYEIYIKANPNGDDLSLAKVKKATAQLRVSTEGARDMRSAFDVARKVIPEVEKEKDFPAARDELTALLPKIAGGFALQARSASSRDNAQMFVGHAEEAMELVNNPSYIPPKMRENIQKTLDEINKNITLAKRTIQKDIALEAAIQQIDAAVQQGNTVEAFGIRARVLKEFPELEREAKLNDKVQEITNRERAAVQSLAVSRKASSEDSATKINALRIVPARRMGQNVVGAENQIVYVLVRGSVFAFDAGTGQLLWRRFVGIDSLIQPIPVSKLSGADAIVSDVGRKEILRLKASTGEVVWRFSIEGTFAATVVVEDRILVSEHSGRILQLDLETGACSIAAQLPQKLTVGIGGNPRVEQVYQIGEHSNVYVLKPETLTCTEVFFLGHRAGTIAIPPVMALQHLFLVENAGADFCLLHILRADERGGGLKRAISEPMRLSGNVVVPLVHTKNRITVLTNFGELRVLSIDPSNEESPIRTDATMVAQARSPIPGYHVVDGASVLVGGDRLSAFDIQTAREQLNRRWSLNESETFIAPLLKVGNAIVHTRRRRGSLGITVSASRMDNGAMIWRTDIASPTPILAYDNGRNQINAVTSLGDVYRLSPEAGIVDKPSEVMEVDGAEVAYSFSEATTLADGRIVLTNQRDRAQILLHNPQMESNSARTIRMDVGDATVNTVPIALGNAVLMALDSGQVHLFSPETGKAAALPFQPALEPGTKAAWRTPVAIGNQFLITDGTKRIFRIGLKDQPQAHLDQLAAGALPAELLGAIAVAGDTVYGAIRRDGSDMVQAFALNDLSVGAEIPLSGRIQAGPWTVGGTALLVSSKEGLVCLDAGQQKRWQSPMPYGELAGPPQLDGETLVLTGRGGVIWRVGLRDGVETGKLEMGDPLLSSAVVTSAGILVTASDGTLLAVRIPSSGEGAAGAGQ